MLGDLQLRLGQIEDLAAFHAVRRLFTQQAAAVGATLDRMPHRAVGLLHHAQRVPRMTRLAARGPLAWRTQTLRLGLGQPVGRRRLVAVVGVLGELLLERLDFGVERLALCSQGHILGFQDGEFGAELVDFA
jgi:hypothetical protein